MAKRTRFSEYQNRYANYRLDLSDDGILFMQCHTDGGSLPTRAQRYQARLSKPYDELVAFFDAIAPRAEEAIEYRTVSTSTHCRTTPNGCCACSIR